MAQKYLNLEQAAERLGMSVADVNAMRERGELRAYRDGANWKFPAEVIEQKAEELGPQEDPQSDAQDGIEIAGDVSAEESDVLLSETELGESGIGASGTIIGDVDLGDEPIRIDSPAPSDIGLAGDSQAGDEGEELVLSDSQLGPSDVGLASKSGSTLNLDALDDDDLVLGDSSGSNISIGGDSGIALVDPADSGLALDEPLQLSGESGDLLLGEDEAIDIASGSDSPTDLRAAESDFTLTSVSEEDDDSDSGSQVIATVDEETGSGFGGSGSMPPMLDGEDFGADAGVGVAAAGGLGDFDAGGLDAGPAAQQPQAAAVDYSLPEAPYSLGVILSLSGCVLLMALALMMSYDLLRNMWSWDKPYALNSSLMDMICGMLGM